jgi:hypothetical protein
MKEQLAAPLNYAQVEVIDVEANFKEDEE